METTDKVAADIKATIKGDELVGVEDSILHGSTAREKFGSGVDKKVNVNEATTLAKTKPDDESFRIQLKAGDSSAIIEKEFVEGAKSDGEVKGFGKAGNGAVSRRKKKDRKGKSEGAKLAVDDCNDDEDNDKGLKPKGAEVIEVVAMADAKSRAAAEVLSKDVGGLMGTDTQIGADFKVEEIAMNAVNPGREAANGVVEVQSNENITKRKEEIQIANKDLVMNAKARFSTDTPLESISLDSLPHDVDVDVDVDTDVESQSGTIGTRGAKLVAPATERGIFQSGDDGGVVQEAKDDSVMDAGESGIEDLQMTILELRRGLIRGEDMVSGLIQENEALKEDVGAWIDKFKTASKESILFQGKLADLRKVLDDPYGGEEGMTKEVESVRGQLFDMEQVLVETKVRVAELEGDNSYYRNAYEKLCRNMMTMEEIVSQGNVLDAETFASILGIAFTGPPGQTQPQLRQRKSSVGLPTTGQTGSRHRKGSASMGSLSGKGATDPVTTAFNRIKSSFGSYFGSATLAETAGNSTTPGNEISMESLSRGTVEGAGGEYAGEFVVVESVGASQNVSQSESTPQSINAESSSKSQGWWGQHQ